MANRHQDSNPHSRFQYRQRPGNSSSDRYGSRGSDGYGSSQRYGNPDGRGYSRRNDDNNRNGSDRGDYGRGGYERDNRYGNDSRRRFDRGRYPSQDRTYQQRPRRPYSSSQTRPAPFEPADPSTYVPVSGVLEKHPNGFGFLRDPAENYDRQSTDPFVPATLIHKLNLREGVLIEGMAQPGQQEQGSRLMEVQKIDGLTLEEYAEVKPFDEMTPINPEFWLKLSTGPEPITTRVMDLLTPLGKGQRALIVAPPRSGKTVLLQQISQAITTNYPDIRVFVLLVDERPEEVTDFRRAVTNAEVVSSSLDCNLESHVRIAQFIIERCKRLTEEGKDVFLLLDSITRLARAFNKWVGNTGRTMSGGVDIRAMDIPKKIFSSARLGEGGGSLTIVGTALVDTGSRMDELIFQEFKGTGNMELVLDRKLAERRIWPAIDISKSGTRREEKLFPPETLRAVNFIRRVLIPMNPTDAMEKLVRELSRCESNDEFFKRFVRHE